MKRPHIHAFFTILGQDNPIPQTELEYSSPFTLLVAVMLSAQATDSSVNKVTRSLFLQANTPEKMLALGQEPLTKAIQSIGLFRTKAKNLMATCRILQEQHGGEVPRQRADLEALPGVGRKTANVVLNIAFGEPTIAVDTHIFRVSNRTGLAKGDTPLKVELALLKCVPKAFKLHAHQWLILHGRYVCQARKPKCLNCKVSLYCDFYRDVNRAQMTPSQ